jgi:hypothetical protein
VIGLGGKQYQLVTCHLSLSDDVINSVWVSYMVGGLTTRRYPHRSTYPWTGLAELERTEQERNGWAAIASTLGLDALPCYVEDPAQLAFDCCAGLAQPQEFGSPRGFCGTALLAARPSSITGQQAVLPGPARTPARMRARGCRCRRMGTVAFR